MIGVLAGMAAVFLGMRLGVVLLNLLFRPVMAAAAGLPRPRLSFLVPARNEAANLPNLFAQIRGLNYPDYELLVLDDHSEDESAALVREESLRDKPVRLLSGKTLPPGWLGKNFACHQLALAASGDYFLFLDADIAELRPGLPEIALAEMQKRNLALLSIFPDQIMSTWGERLVVPLMHYILLSLLPLWAIFRFRFPSLAAANGQFMLFDAAFYRANHWHERVKSVIVEDIAIMQEVKKRGLKGMTFLADGLIRCRMYHSLKEAVGGFSKNILAGFGNSIAGLMVFLFLIYFSWIGLVFYLPEKYLLAVGAMMLVIRAGISFLARQNMGLNLLLHPFQIVMLVVIALGSVKRRISGKNEWKGRNVMQNL
ncbi:MAG: glycosyltransferase family 2 protein [Bacteroidia bacterium]|nr:glycosyltransferase family 2 protein [Bacteroidia bacterium]